MTERINWRHDDAGNLFGYAGEAAWPLFTIDAPLAGLPWTLASPLPIPEAERGDQADDPGKLKAEAERRLEQFVSSLGAIFPVEPAKSRKSRAWHADWTATGRDQDGKTILRYKPSGGLYRILPVEES